MAFQPLYRRREERVLELVHLTPLLVLNRTYVVMDVSFGRVKFVLWILCVRLKIADRAQSGGDLLKRRHCSEQVALRLFTRLGRRFCLHEKTAIFIAQTANGRRELLFWKTVERFLQMGDETLLDAGELKLENAEILIIYVYLLLARLTLL